MDVQTGMPEVWQRFGGQERSMENWDGYLPLPTAGVDWERITTSASVCLPSKLPWYVGHGSLTFSW